MKRIKYKWAFLFILKAEQLLAMLINLFFIAFVPLCATDDSIKQAEPVF